MGELRVETGLETNRKSGRQLIGKKEKFTNRKRRDPIEENGRNAQVGIDQLNGSIKAERGSTAKR
jgi:hypothetical protein